MTERTPSYGRLLGDFDVGATYEHPWEVTVDDGMRALFAASFLDATPAYASTSYARDLGFRDRPIPPVLLFNLALSMSVHDVSEQAIALLGYDGVAFPAAAFTGDTVHARSVVVEVKLSAAGAGGEKGVVTVETELVRDDDAVVCRFRRSALVPGGRLAGRPRAVYLPEPRPAQALRDSKTNPLPVELRDFVRLPKRSRGFSGFADDLAVGDVLWHAAGRTVSEAEPMQLAFLLRNSHPLHFDEVYAKEGGSFAKTRVVYGGLVFAWVNALASRDTAGNVLWDVGFDRGAHPSGVVEGDTLFAASKVLAIEPGDHGVTTVTFRLVGTKNVRPRDLSASGLDLFLPEHGKHAGKVAEKVFEVDKTVLMRSRA
jgi:2-methylfumaryl-CoA hydratase